jgi:hypothetical protein
MEKYTIEKVFAGLQPEELLLKIALRTLHSTSRKRFASRNMLPAVELITIPVRC